MLAHFFARLSLWAYVLAWTSCTVCQVPCSLVFTSWPNHTPINRWTGLLTKPLTSTEELSQGERGQLKSGQLLARLQGGFKPCTQGWDELSLAGFFHLWTQVCLHSRKKLSSLQWSIHLWWRWLPAIHLPRQYRWWLGFLHFKSTRGREAVRLAI